MNFETGSLVNFRGRDWVVLPPVDADSLMLKPLGGIDAETVQAYPELERISSATFPLPDPNSAGDARSCSILRDAIRLGLRSTTGPFRSFGHIAVEPRPYQLVPMLMAMKQDIIRMLIADDVGIGKTVEALLIARELLDRGEIKRMAILCPPQLAEQWQKELAEKFHIDACLVLPSTINRLERGLGAGTSLFEKYPFTIVSLDFIKSERHRLDFIRACPELVIVDEAHACASASGGKGRKQRYELVSELAKKPDRNMIFVTATPHSGKEDVFRSLLAFLNPEFADLPEDLGGPQNEKARRRLAEFFVQRRRGDIRAFMEANTPFPSRKAQEITWTANAEWRELFDKSLALARDNIESEAAGSLWRQRISWWSALALLRAVSSSPAAASQTLMARALGCGEQVENIPQLDMLGIQSVFDLDSGDESAIMDTLPGADTSQKDLTASPGRARYRRLAKMADALKGARDSKLQGLVPHLKKLLSEGYSPVVFCRFIPTAEYLADELRNVLPKCEIEAVTGLLPPAEREARVLRLAEKEKRILICTDCLSEGINLQESFNAVIHYDLSWNPTRHEQREGRVDRFGQAMPEVRIITWWGQDNPMDGMVLDVLLRKHEAIRKSLGISVPVPEDSEKIMETLLKGLLLRKQKTIVAEDRLFLPGMEEYVEPEKKRVAAEWDDVAKKEEKRSRTLFAQQTIKTDDVAASLAQANEAGGGINTVEQFVDIAMPLLGGVKQEVYKDGQKIASFNFEQLCRTKHQGLELPSNDASFVFSLPVKRGQTYLTRTHPLVERMAAYLAENALDAQGGKIIARCGAMRTASVVRRTTLILCRFRFQITTSGDVENTSLAEECAALAFSGSPQNAEWLPESDVSGLLAALPVENVDSEQASGWIRKVEDGMPELLSHIETYQNERANALLNAHRKVRDASKRRNIKYKVQAQGKPDILGIFIYLPAI